MAGSRREWLRKKMNMAGDEEHISPPRWSLRKAPPRAAGLSYSPWRRWRKHFRSLLLKPALVLRMLLDRLVFSLLSAVEAVVLAASLCFFYLRFGFRL